MKRRRREYPLGTVSHATMRAEDLIPCFANELIDMAKNRMMGNVTPEDRREHIKEARAILARAEQPGYYTGDDCSYDLNEYLFDVLGEYAGPYFYFGSHPGDGSDYGFWLSDDFQHDFDGLTVDDMGKVPDDYAGEILYINDHGNTSLYVKARTQEPREIWAIV